VDRQTRKELKSDKFVQEVGHSVEYLAEHKEQIRRYGIVAAAVLLVVVAFLVYRNYQMGVRQDALQAAIRIQDAYVGDAPPGMPKYATLEEKEKAVTQAFTDLSNKYPGTQEGEIARYYLATMAADKGRLSEAEGHYRGVINSGLTAYASLAKLALGEILASQGKVAEAESLVKSVVDSPTVLVSKEEATLTLARILKQTKPEEARKLLEPLRTERSAVSRAAVNLLGEISMANR
jgi:predicted negative regulator of RcsB-dependent stress response